MSPITARATHRRVLSYHAQQLAILLSKLDQGLRLAGIDPDHDRQYLDVVATIRETHYKIGTLGKATCGSEVAAEMYLDNRGLTP
jgi:hypothetical protein